MYVIKYIKTKITGILFRFGASLNALAWQLMSSGGSCTMGIRVPEVMSVHVASFTMSFIRTAVSTGALWDCKLSLVHRRNQCPSQAKWQPQRKGFSEMVKPPETRTRCKLLPHTREYPKENKYKSCLRAKLKRLKYKHTTLTNSYQDSLPLIPPQVFN